MTQTDLVDTQISAAVNQNPALSKEGLLERCFGHFFKGLVYAQIWEDPVVDMQALQLTPQDHVVCIASGGCNVLSYLTANPASITAVDLSPAHVMLNRLKLAAAQHLPNHAAFYDMLGHANRAQNVGLFDQYLAPHMEAEARQFWNARTLAGRRKTMFATGLYRHGLLGRFLWAVKLITRVAGVDFTPFLRCKTLGEQKTFFDAQIAPLFETRFVKALVSHRASLFGLGIPPAQYEKLAADAGGDIVSVLRERSRKLFCDFPVAENYFVWQATTRGYDPSGTGPVPPYLMAEHHAVVQRNAERVTVLNQSVTDVLAAQPAKSKHAYVLLDAQDWMTDAQLNELWSEITRTAAPGARVIFRTGGLEDILPGRVQEATLSKWRYDAKAARAGTAADRSAIYGAFHVYRLRVEAKA